MNRRVQKTTILSVNKFVSYVIVHKYPKAAIHEFLMKKETKKENEKSNKRGH